MMRVLSLSWLVAVSIEGMVPDIERWRVAISALLLVRVVSEGALVVVVAKKEPEEGGDGS